MRILGPVPRRSLMPAVLLVALLLSGCATVSTVRWPSPEQEDAIETAAQTVPETYQLDVKFALYRARGNRGEMIEALQGVSGDELTGMAFLIAQMPLRDLRRLKADYLIENVTLAYRARRELPWGADIPEDVFLNEVLPYVNINETRDEWRRYFFDKYADAARGQATVEAAATYLNRKVFEDHGITYDIKKRPKPDQSPRETMAVGVASCTGQAIMIADVLRSVGIPARLVGTPLWSDRSGNHTWIEVWDRGEWHFLEAAGKDGFDTAWFSEPASLPAMTGPQHRIYAASFRRTGLLFPTLWNPYAADVYAVDVTDRYQP